MAAKNSDVRDFLTSRRAKITLDMVDLPPTRGVRRVPGLRREEVAMLAGVSVDYYTRIEKGDLSGVSDEILDAVAQALRLEQDEIAYLYDLARLAHRPSRLRTRTRQPRSVPPHVQMLIDSMSTVPVIARTGALDVLASNALGQALFADVYDSPTRRSVAAAPNMASFVFLDPAAREFYDDLDEAAAVCVRALRSRVAMNPQDRRLTEIIGELSTRSDDFRARWGPTKSGSTGQGARSSGTGRSANSPLTSRSSRWNPHPRSSCPPMCRNPRP
jgi:transcriptional regulator with XRE-family HTH domain